LSGFGLTGNEARAYVALVKLGVAAVNKIVQLSKIRREEIYRIMPKLEQLGLVERILGKPTKYKPISLAEALSILFKYRQEESDRKIAELAEKKASLLKDLEFLENEKAIAIQEEEGAHFILILDRDKSLHKLTSMTNAAQKEIAITADSSEFQYGVSKGYDDALRSAAMKGVKVRVLLKIDEVSEPLLFFAKEIELFKDIIEVRHVDQIRIHIMVVDDKETSIGTYLDPNKKEVVNLWSDHPSFIGAMKDIFERQWHEGVDLKSRVMELETGKPVERTEVIRGRDNIYARIFAGLSKTNSNLLTIVDGTALNFIKRDFISVNITTKNRGTRRRFLTTIDGDNLEVAEELSKYIEIRHLDRVPIRAMLGDEEIGFSWIPVKEMPETAIYSNNREIVQMMWEIAENYWNNAVDGQARIDEIRERSPIGRD
jgi:sugar-specific transcriptional regulator TrmB